MLHESRATRRGCVAHQLEPAEDGRRHRLIVTERTVRPSTLAGDDVGKAVGVDVLDADRMDLAESSAVRVVGGGAAEDDALGEGAVRVLLEPREPVAVRADARDDIGAAVAVDIERVHLRAALAEVRGVERPEALVG